MIKLMFRFLLRNKLKNILMLIQFSLSFFALFMLMTETTSLVKAYSQDLGYSVKNLIGGRISNTWNLKTEQEFMELKSQMMSAINEIRELPYVKKAGYIMTYPYSNWTRSSNDYGVCISSPEAIEALGLELVDGRFYNDDDAFTSHDDLILMNKEPYDELVEKNNNRSVIGKNFWKLTANDTSTVERHSPIIGVFKNYRMYGRFNFRYSNFRLSIARLDNDEYYKKNGWGQIRNSSGFLVRSDGSVSVSTAMQEVDRIMKRNILNRDVSLHSIEQLEQQRSKGPKRNFIILFFICLILTFIISIGIVAMTKENLLKRTKEIGIRMALGSTERQVLHSFFGEHLILTTLSAFLSSTLIFVSANYQIIKFKLDPLLFILAFIVLIAIVILSGFKSIHKASKQKPNIALHYE